MPSSSGGICLDRDSLEIGKAARRAAGGASNFQHAKLSSTTDSLSASASTELAAPAAPPPAIHAGTPEFRRINLALFAAGFATFALLYCVQPLMPVFAEAFNVSPSASSLPLSLTTGLLAPAMIVAGAISETRGRKSIMVVSLAVSSVLTVVAAFAPTWNVLLVARALAGITFAGLPAVSVAYLSEEVHPTSLGLAIGLMIGGNGLGGMIGRLLTAFVADAFGWRVAIGAIAVLGLVATFIFWRALPASRHFVPRAEPVREIAANFAAHLTNVRLAPLFAEGFLLMGAFVTAYNYVTYHLIRPPFSLSHSAVGLIFIVYLLGIVASAWIGALAGRVGRGRTLAATICLMAAGVLLMTIRSTVVVIAGIATTTFGFFGAHSVASTWVGLRATRAKSQASGLYFFFYYLGSSVVGVIGGLFWEQWEWPGVVGFLLGLLAAALLALAILTSAGEPVRERPSTS